jgi:organic hydroperoxide reductase OsmC/OhrA
MSQHRATIRWKCTGTDFISGKYSREHTWSFDGGLVVSASSSPSVVPAPWSNSASVDPEEAYVAAVSSCHMLTFLYLAGKAGFHVDGYEDEAIGTMTRNERGTPWVSAVTLQPKISYIGSNQPGSVEEERLHHEAHDQCFIAQSIKTEVTVRAGSHGSASPGATVLK